MALPLCMVFLLALWLLNLSAVSAQKCYALALAGGGDKGAYESGVIFGLVSILPPAERQWQVVTGISAGSIVASGMVVYSVGDEENMADYLVGMAVNLTQPDIFVDWPGGVVQGLLDKQSLFDATPLRNTLAGVLSKGIKDRIVIVGAVSLADGSFHMWDQNDRNFFSAALASASIPGIFQPQSIDGNLYVDGGTLYTVNVFGAVERCRSLGVSDEDIVVDIISCFRHDTPPPVKPPIDMKTLDVLLRASEIASAGTSNQDINEVMQSFPNVNFRYNIAPSIPIPGSGIAFNHTEMEEMVVLGIADAINAVKGLNRLADGTMKSY